MKERLTGAIILVALIVLLVPELLTGPIRTKSAPAVSPTVASPSVAPAARTQPPLRSYTLTLGAAPQGQEAAATPSAALPAPVQPVVSPAQGPAQSPENGPKASDGPQHATAPDGAASSPGASRSARTGSRLQAAKSPAHPSVPEARSSASSSTGWVVQLGSFASRENADRLAHSLSGRGFRMSVSPARTGARVLWRVRAGPAHDRAAAQHLAARLRALGHRGELLPVR